MDLYVISQRYHALPELGIRSLCFSSLLQSRHGDFTVFGSLTWDRNDMSNHESPRSYQQVNWLWARTY